MMFVLLVFAASTAKADELRPGYIEFNQQSAQDWTLLWKVPTRGGFISIARPTLPAGCAVSATPSRIVAEGSAVTTARVFCSGNVAGGFIGLDNFGAAQSDVLVRVAPLNRPVQALRLTPSEPRAMIAAKPSRWQVAQTYFSTGIDHILFGFDHLLFVVALVLLLPGFWTVAKAVTAFTVAHSLTLIGTTFGLFGLPQRPVESVIALSILFLAVEILKQSPDEPRLSQRAPWLIAFAFGLLHGFGFAGALQEIGLPESDVATALLTFNLGVEAGQIAIVAATAGGLVLVRRVFDRWHGHIVRGIAYVIGIIAGFWFIERTLS